MHTIITQKTKKEEGKYVCAPREMSMPDPTRATPKSWRAMVIRLSSVLDFAWSRLPRTTQRETGRGNLTTPLDERTTLSVRRAVLGLAHNKSTTITTEIDFLYSDAESQKNPCRGS